MAEPLESDKIRQAVREILSRVSPSERESLRRWAEGARGSSEYSRLVNARTPKVALELLKAILGLMKEKAWTDRSWAERAGLIGVAALSTAFAGRLVGLRALRWGLTSSAPALLAYLNDFFHVLLEELGKREEFS